MVSNRRWRPNLMINCLRVYFKERRGGSEREAFWRTIVLDASLYIFLSWAGVKVGSGNERTSTTKLFLSFHPILCVTSSHLLVLVQTCLYYVFFVGAVDDE